MKTLKTFTLLFLCLLTIPIWDANATELRGRVDSMNYYAGTVYPVSGVEVQLLFWNGQFWQVFAATLTNRGGFYYFNQAPPGSYILNVAGRKEMVVVNNVYSQDFPPFMIQ